MKKLFIMMAALLGCTTMCFAQETTVATLQHNGSTTICYGKEALAYAYSIAEDGDIISLSPGLFSFSGDFTKGITVRGMGIDADEKTTIISSMSFYSTGSTERVTTIEGIYFSSSVRIYGKNSDNGQGTINFTKCLLGSVYAYINSGSETPKTRFYNCIINDRMEFAYNSVLYNYQFLNCYVKDPYAQYVNCTNSTAFVNCVIRYQSVYPSESTFLNFYNCIFSSSLSAGLPQSATATNCVSINTGNNFFSSVYNPDTNKTVSNYSDVFKSGEPTYSAGERFELTASAAATYLGNDGTQVGMHGGQYPYTTKVQYPVVTTLKADKTSKEGMLNIQVGVDE